MQNGIFTIFGITFIFLMTMLGAAVVYLFKNEMPTRLQSAIFGFAGGIMLAASVWSLLLPAIEQAQRLWNSYSFIPISVGFLVGGLLLVALEGLFQKYKNSKGNKCTMDSRARKLFLSMTLHNIPEGLAVGFAFGAAHAVGTTAAYVAALGLAIGIGIQNFPEGAAVSLPIKSALKSKKKAVFFAFISAIVEPIFAIIGYFFATALQGMQAWLLAFAAGAMIFVVAEELLPASKEDKDDTVGAWGLMLGFLLMMLLDVCFS